jgi:prevent-host-death family protein
MKDYSGDRPQQQLEAGVRDLKIHASQIVRRVRERRVRYRISYRGKPVAMLTPLPVVSAETGEPDATGQDPWDELLRLRDEISRGWKSRRTATEILSSSRR